MINNNGFPFLLVEDNKHDVRFVQRAWKVNRISNPLYVVPHGQACLDYLRHEGAYIDEAAHPRPGVIFLDIRMPIMNGLECLQQLKSDQTLKRIPVIMLTTSKEEEDRLRSYDIGCNSFMQKPVNFKKLAEAIRAVHLFWTVSELPPS